MEWDSLQFSSIFVNFSMEVIVEVTSLSLLGRFLRWVKKAKQSDIDAIFVEGEDPMKDGIEYALKKLSKSWDKMEMWVIRYFLLDGRYTTDYSIILDGARIKRNEE